MHQKSKEQKWWLGLRPEAIKLVNELIDEWPFRMFEIRNGNLYLLLKHHSYINFRDSKVVKLAKCTWCVDGYYYRTERVQL